MLLNSFYTLHNIKPSENGFSCDVALNSSHPIFKGHFPGEPIVPGVTMVKLCQEVIGLALTKKLSLKEAKQIKFLSVVNPEIDGVLKCGFSLALNDSGKIKADFSLSKNDGTVAFKMSGLFV